MLFFLFISFLLWSSSFIIFILSLPTVCVQCQYACKCESQPPERQLIRYCKVHIIHSLYLWHPKQETRPSSNGVQNGSSGQEENDEISHPSCLHYNIMTNLVCQLRSLAEWSSPTLIANLLHTAQICSPYDLEVSNA